MIYNAMNCGPRSSHVSATSLATQSLASYLGAMTYGAEVAKTCYLDAAEKGVQR
jgi:hypothetical protein